MGCDPSKETTDDGIELRPRPRQQVELSGPTGGPVLIPPPYRDADGRPIQHTSSELDRETIKNALEDMAVYLGKRDVRTEIVTVGGAVNTLYLRSRQSTHDVDFFLGDASSTTHHVLHEAARFANRQRGGQLGADWLNNATQLFMPAKLQQALFQEALAQHVIVFEQDGLKVYAAPWSYAFCGKLNRMCEASPRSYDLADAVVYLHQYLQTTGSRCVAADQVREWCRRYSKSVTDDVLRLVEGAYHEKYGQHVVKWVG